MKRSIQSFSGKSKEQLTRCYTLLLFLFILFNNHLIAQADLGNIKNNLSSIKEEQAKQAHEEFMSYVYMSLGFALVIAVAWFSTVQARKRKIKEDEMKLNHYAKHTPRDPYKRGGLHKARR